MNVLITGIRGFLGKDIFQYLKNNHNIIGLAREKGSFDEILVYGSANLDEIEFDPEFIIGCHASVSSGTDQASTLQLFNSNVLLTESICKRFPDSKMIFISTGSIYENCGQEIEENSKNNPVSHYALSKMWGERIVSEQKNSIILRLSSMYGIGMRPNTIIPNYIEQALSRGEITVWGDGSRHQNYIHVSDVVRYINAIIKKYPSCNKELFLGVFQREYSNLELAKIISKKTGAEIIFANYDSSISFSYNNSLTNHKLGLQPKMSFEKGLEKYIECEQKKY